MLIFREPALTLDVIGQEWSEELGRSLDKVLIRLLEGLWVGRLEDEPSKRLLALRVIYHRCRRYSDDAVFFAGDEDEPPVNTHAANGDLLVDARSRIHVPNHEPITWTVASCQQAFQEMAIECAPGCSLPWYLQDEVRVALLGIEISYTAFRRFLDTNKWEPPRFWEPLEGADVGSGLSTPGAQSVAHDMTDVRQHGFPLRQPGESVGGGMVMPDVPTDVRGLMPDMTQSELLAYVRHTEQCNEAAAQRMIELAIAGGWLKPDPPFNRNRVAGFWRRTWGIAKARRWVTWLDQNAPADASRRQFRNYVKMNEDKALLDRLRNGDIEAKAYRDGAWVKVPPEDWRPGWAPAGFKSVVVDAGTVQAHFPASSRRLRELRIMRFARHQHRMQQWFCLADIADWCAREDGTVGRNESKRVQAFEDLRKSLLEGDFEGGRVLYLPPEPAPQGVREPRRMTTETLRVIVETYDADAIKCVLASCWLPRKLCHEWFDRHRIAPPAEWLKLPKGKAREQNPAVSPATATRWGLEEQPPSELSTKRTKTRRDYMAALSGWMSLCLKLPNHKCHAWGPDEWVREARRHWEKEQKSGKQPPPIPENRALKVAICEKLPELKASLAANKST